MTTPLRWGRMIAAILGGSIALWLAQQNLLAQDGYHRVPLEQMATTRWTHVCTVGPVVYVRKMKDGDIHVTLDNGRAKVVLEIIPQLPLPRPKKWQRIEACGITRIDKHHGWPELHPLLSWKAAR